MMIAMLFFIEVVSKNLEMFEAFVVVFMFRRCDIYNQCMSFFFFPCPFAQKRLFFKGATSRSYVDNI